MQISAPPTEFGRPATAGRLSADSSVRTEDRILDTRTFGHSTTVTDFSRRITDLRWISSGRQTTGQGLNSNFDYWSGTEHCAL